VHSISIARALTAALLVAVSWVAAAQARFDFEQTSTVLPKTVVEMRAALREREAQRLGATLARWAPIP
jgi:hypothetical protein